MYRKCDLLVLACAAAISLGYGAIADPVTNADPSDTSQPQTETLAELKQKIFSDPQNRKIYIVYAKRAKELGKPEEMAWVYEKLLDVDPNLPRVKLDLAIVYCILQRFDKARALLNAMLEENTPENLRKDIRVVFKKVDELQQQVQVAPPQTAAASPIPNNDLPHASQPQPETLAELKQKIISDPSNKPNYISYAKRAKELSKPEDMAWAYEKLLDVDPNLPRVKLDLAVVYCILLRFDNARSLLNGMLAKNPPENLRNDIHVVLAKVDEVQQQAHVGTTRIAVASPIPSAYQSAASAQQEALAGLKQKIISDPHNKDNYIAYAKRAKELHNPEEMAWAYEKLLDVDPNLPRVKLDLAVVYCILLRFDNARSLLNGMLAKNPPENLQNDIHLVLAKVDEVQQRIQVGTTQIAAASSIPNDYQSGAAQPRQEALAELKQRIASDPRNKDNYVAYAQRAKEIGNPEEVAWAYEQLLDVDPNLQRVKLDLSVIYFTLRRFDDARSLLDSVLATNPPETVQTNIRAVLAKIDEAQQRNHVNASLTVGMGWDTNANAAPNSGYVLILDNLVPLGNSNKQHSDFLGFSSITLADSYDVGKVFDDTGLIWRSSAITYQTQQHALNDLNLQLYGVRTGPEFIYQPLDLHANLTVGYNYLLLHTEPYLRNPSAALTFELPIFPSVQLWFGPTIEYREFINAHTNKTYTQRNGQARQIQEGIRYTFSDRSQWEAIYTLRHENASESFYANQQSGVTLSHAYAFAPDFADGWLADVYTVGQLGYKQSVYDAPDVLISNKVRDDNEQLAQFTIGKKITPDIIINVSYTFTDEISNIKNYRYDDRRYMTSITKNLP